MPRAVRLRRLGYRAAHAGLRVWWAVRRPHTRGVKCLLRRDGGELLFVRHTYGRRREWELPGGTVRRHEAPADAARREGREELGLEPVWRAVGTAEVGGDGKTTTLHAFLADADADAGAAAALRLTPVELAEARWAPADAPPEPVGRDVRPVLALLGAGRR
jgi:8-oxo-dGTP diphosphatase